MKEVYDFTKEKMSKCISSLEYEYSSIRAGRANPAVLDRISADYYGAMTPINQLASVSVLEARILVIQPYDISGLKAIEKAIQSSDLGINPTNDGKVIRIVFPQPTEERRKELVKGISKTAEDSKVAVRNVRRDAIDKIKALKKSNEITEDEQKDGEKKIQKITDDFIAQVEDVFKAKEAEIMAI